jgi:hypothetical protein
VRPLVKAQPCWAQTRANGPGRMGPGADWWERARMRGIGRGLFARPRMWVHMRRVQTGRKGCGLQAQTRGTGRGLFARPRLWTHMRRAQTQVNGRRWVGPSANTMSSLGRKAIRVQPLGWGHVSGRGRVRGRARARTGACCREGGHTREPKGRTRLRGRGV